MSEELAWDNYKMWDRIDQNNMNLNSMMLDRVAWKYKVMQIPSTLSQHEKNKTCKWWWGSILKVIKFLWECVAIAFTLSFVLISLALYLSLDLWLFIFIWEIVTYVWTWKFSISLYNTSASKFLVYVESYHNQ